MGYLVGAVVGGFASVMICQALTSQSNVNNTVTTICANADGGIPHAMLVGAAVGAVVGGMLLK